MKRILSSVWFLSLLISIPLFFLLPPVFDKYECQLLHITDAGTHENTGIYYVDLDSDGIPERIKTFSQKISNNSFSFQYYRANGGMIDQINWPIDFHTDTNVLYFADVNKDNHKEVYTFSFERDSLFLYWLQLTPKATPIQSIPICKINYYNEDLIDYSLSKLHCVDLDNDGKNELIFSVNGGFSIVPRQIIKVDPETGKTQASENTGCANFCHSFDDLDGDGDLEIIADGAVAPIRDSFDLPFNVPAPFLKVLDVNLNNFFSPVKFYEGILSYTSTSVINRNHGKELICTFLSKSADCVPFRAYKINLKGEKTDSMVYNSQVRQRSTYVFRLANGNFITQIAPSELLEYTEDLKIARVLNLESTGNLDYVMNGDLNNDGVEEVLLQDRDKGILYIFSDNFKRHLEMETGSNSTGITSAMVGEGDKLYLTTNRHFIELEFGKNPMHYLRFPVYLAVYLFILLLVFILQRIIEYRLQAKYKLRQQVLELELKSYQNQMDPHFMFNSFNSVAALLKKGNQDEAYNTFIKFSKLVRLNFEDTQNITRLLKDELQVVRDFLEINKMRFKEKLDYVVEVENEEVFQCRVPKMILQIHVENALKHGLAKMKGNGFVSVKVKRRGNYLELSVEDNGIGRLHAALLNRPSTKQGLKMLAAIYDQLNQHNKHKITQRFTDLEDNAGNPSGTRVEIEIPVNLKG